MTGIELNILWWNDSQSQLSELGVRPDVGDAETRTVTFYTIDNISPYHEDGKEYTSIKSGGDEYIAPQRYYEIKNLLAIMDILK